MDIDPVPHAVPRVAAPATLAVAQPAQAPTDSGQLQTTSPPQMRQPSPRAIRHDLRYSPTTLARAWTDLAQVPVQDTAMRDGGVQDAPECSVERAIDIGDSDSDGDSAADCITQLIQLSQRHDRPESEPAWCAAMPPLALALSALSFKPATARDTVMAEADALLSQYPEPGYADVMYGRSVLHWLSLVGDATIVGWMLRRTGGRDINRADFGGLTPLSLVVQLRVSPVGSHRPPDTIAIVSLLVEHGAQLDSLPEGGRELLYLPDLTPELARRLVAIGVPVEGSRAERETPMLRACMRSNWALASTLLDLGAQAGVRGRFRSSALHTAQLPVPLARQLIECGASVHARDLLGLTPLLSACQSGNVPLAQLLLQYGASPEARSDDGLSVLDAAQTSGGAIEQLIREALMLQPALKLASE